MPYTYTERLSKASSKDLQDYRFIENGIGIHFSKIDEDISVDRIIIDFGNQSKRINISVTESFLDVADKYAKEHNMSRSALLQKATMEFIAL